MQNLLLVTALAFSLAHPLQAAAEESDFTALDEIDRVRKDGCHRDRFDEFLSWYAGSTDSGGWLEQVVFTDYVMIGKLDDPSAPASDYSHRQDYLGNFRIDTFDLQASRRNIPRPTGSEYRLVTTKRLDENRYQVDWQGGLSWAGGDRSDWDRKKGAYIFEFKKDCWYLTADLR